MRNGNQTKRNGKIGNMKILISGNLGYIGPVLINHIKALSGDNFIAGYDLGLFSHVNSTRRLISDVKVDVQYFGDVRDVKQELFNEFDAVIYLAAISNDPMGNKFEEPTLEINYKSAVKWAEYAKAAGVSNFVFASSCSVYGLADDEDRTEKSEVNPLTIYAKSKVYAERDLALLASAEFNITCLRFATACGWSDRVRLDLVLNDFVAGAKVNKKIEILSDGSPWRPLIHVKDMSRAIEWAASRQTDNGGNFLITNVGSNSWNLQIKELAFQVKKKIGGTDVYINPEGAPDKRSYRVSFDFFSELAPNHQPIETPASTIEGLFSGLLELNFEDPDFRSSDYIRLKIIQDLIHSGELTDEIKRAQ